MHIDETGRVTGYTGKAEIGQNIRTSLAQAIADELRVPLTGGLAGDGGHRPRAVRPGNVRFPVDAADGAAPGAGRGHGAGDADRPGGGALADRSDRVGLPRTAGSRRRTSRRAYGELSRAGSSPAWYRPTRPFRRPSAWAIRGTAATKVDGRELRHRPASLHAGSHASGHDVWTDHSSRWLQRHAGVFRRCSAARAIAGVTVVRDGDFVGIVAPTRAAGRRAAAAIRAEWRLPTGAPSSSTIYDHLKKSETTGGGRGSTPSGRGDVAAARAAAARTFDATYHIPYIAHVPLEPRCRGRRVDRRQADGLDRHAAARSACGPSWRRRSACPRTGCG